MSFLRSLLLPILAGLGLILSGALAQQTSPPAKSPSAAPPAKPKADLPLPKADPKATATLDQALEALDPKRLKWMKTTLWQQVDVQGLTFQAEGAYLAGPDHRMRLDLAVHLGGTTGKLEVVSDGTDLWQVQQVGKGERTVTKVQLREVLQALDNPRTPAEVRDEYYRTESFAGLVPLLKSIREQMAFTGQEEATWHGHRVLKLTGLWNRPEATSEKRWLPYIPRLCRVYLDAKTLWPHRIEWWGPTPPRAEEALLMQMEFRDPVLHQELPAATFRFDPGTTEFADRTRESAERVRRRTEELEAQKRMTPRKLTDPKSR
jgi:hypothetical protein